MKQIHFSTKIEHILFEDMQKYSKCVEEIIGLSDTNLISFKNNQVTHIGNAIQIKYIIHNHTKRNNK